MDLKLEIRRAPRRAYHRIRQEMMENNERLSKRTRKWIYCAAKSLIGVPIILPSADVYLYGNQLIFVVVMSRYWNQRYKQLNI